MSTLSNGSWKVQTQGYSRTDALKICSNKLIVFVGDSVVRGMYKDLVTFLRNGTMLTDKQLRMKGEASFENDVLVEGGTLDGLFNGKHYIEVREYRTRSLCVRFYFITRCYYDYMETILQDFMEQPTPDVVYMSSCCWDVTRWNDEIKAGPNALSKYKANLEILFNRLVEVLPAYCIVIWGCCLPMGSEVRGGFLEPEMQFKAKTLRLDILEANYFASVLAERHKFDVLDFHWYFRQFQTSRKDDGIHWNTTAHRNMTFMFLYQISEAWGVTDLQLSETYAVKMVAEKSLKNFSNFPRPSGYEQLMTASSGPSGRPARESSSYKIMRGNSRRAAREAPYKPGAERDNSSNQRNEMNGRLRMDNMGHRQSQCQDNMGHLQSQSQKMYSNTLMPMHNANPWLPFLTTPRHLHLHLPQPFGRDQSTANSALGNCWGNINNQPYGF